MTTVNSCNIVADRTRRRDSNGPTLDQNRQLAPSDRASEIAAFVIKGFNNMRGAT